MTALMARLIRPGYALPAHYYTGFDSDGVLHVSTVVHGVFTDVGERVRVTFVNATDEWRMTNPMWAGHRANSYMRGVMLEPEYLIEVNAARSVQRREGLIARIAREVTDFMPADDCECGISDTEHGRIRYERAEDDALNVTAECRGLYGTYEINTVWYGDPVQKGRLREMLVMMGANESDL